MSDENKNIDLIFRFLTKEADEIEIQTLNSLVSTDIEFKKIFDDYSKTWNLTNEKIDNEVFDIDVNLEWKRLEKTIETKQNSTKIINIKRKSKYIFFKIAAIVLIFVTIGLIINYSIKPRTYEFASSNSILEKEMPDGSTITLSKESQISYNDNFNVSERNIKLRGEAYFEVKHNSEKKFIVEVADISVEVVGTEFYIISTDSITEVIVKTGKVLVYKTDNKSDSVYITNGEKVEFSEKVQNIEKSVNEDENFISWKTKVFTFDNETFGNIIKYLEKAYSIEIETKNKDIENCRISTTFTDQSIESIFTVLETLLDIKVTKNAYKYIVDGNGC